eukprot:gene5611-7747_t
MSRHLLNAKTGHVSSLAFAKNRNMNVDFYEWYWDKIVLPFVEEIRDEHYMGTQQNVRLTAAVNCDGEDVQIKVFSRPEFQNKLHNAGIIVDKPSGSTTEITQTLDAGPLFITKIII